jgi:hypothetical protein
MIARPPKMTNYFVIDMREPGSQNQALLYSSKISPPYHSIRANPVKAGDAKPTGLKSRK